MNITRAAIEKNRITALILIIIVVGGVVAYLRSPRDYDPGFILRVARVVTYFPGAGPERVEQLVTDKLEKVIQEMPEIDFIRSESKTGISIIDVEIQRRYKKLRPIWDSLRRKVVRAQADLPEGVIGPFVNDEFGDVFGVVIGIIGEGFSYAELKDIADQVRDALLLLEDVAKVEIYGAQEERVFLEFNNARLSELGLSPYQLMNVLDSHNIIIPGGNLLVGPERIGLEPSGNFESLEEVRRTVINVPGHQEAIFLEDIVGIRRGYIDPPHTKMRTSGQPSLGLAVSMREGGNLIHLGAEVQALINRLQGQYPHGLEFEFVSFQPEEVNRKVSEFRNNLLQATAVVVLVMLITLGIRTGLLVASLIPMTILMSLSLMYVLGIGLDQISLAAMIIALGMLVDNAIVMSESIMVQISEGKAALEAAVDSARELIVPLLTSSLTTAAAFLPIYLAKSDTGEYTAPLFKVVTITLLSSWLLSLTMIPLLCVNFLHVRKKQKGLERPLFRWYRWLLLKALRHRVASLALTLALLAAGLWSAQFLPVIFFPPSDRMYFKAEFELPSGSGIETTERTMDMVESFISNELVADNDETIGVTNWVTHIGNAGPRFLLQHNPKPGVPEYALMVVNVNTIAALDPVIARLDEFVAQNIPDVDAKYTKIENGPPLNYPVEIRIIGNEADALFEIADNVKGQLKQMNGVRNIKDDWGQRIKKLVVRIDQPRAWRAGVTSRDVAISLQAVLSGFDMTEFREEDKIIPVTLRSVAADRQDISKIESLNVYAQATGQSVPLRQVADIEVVWQPAKIIRRDRLKTVTVSADLYPGTTANEITSALVPRLDEQVWDIGYRYELGGEAETSGEANQSIKEQLPVAGIIIVLLLVGQFNSFRRAAIILFTIPLGLIGVILGLFAARLYFGFMTLLGIISLSGIVINNAIVLLERIKLEIVDNHLPPQKAVVEAAQRRLRPILLTTATTVFGMMPLYLKGGAMWEPMAMAIIAGLIFATLLTLGVVPVLFSLLFGVRFE